MAYRKELGPKKAWITFGGMIELLHNRVASAGDDAIPTATIVARLGITQAEFDAYLQADVAPETVIKQLGTEFKTYLKGHVVEKISITEIHYPDDDLDYSDNGDLEEI